MVTYIHTIHTYVRTEIQIDSQYRYIRSPLRGRGVDNDTMTLLTDVLMRRLQLRFVFDSTPVRRLFDCISKVIKVTVT